MNVTVSQLHKFSKELCGKEQASELNFTERCKVAKRLLYMCFQYGVSSGIDEKASFGYGELNTVGEWQFPLMEADLLAMKAGTL